jgi:hypothetical protein
MAKNNSRFKKNSNLITKILTISCTNMTGYMNVAEKLKLIKIRASFISLGL